MLIGLISFVLGASISFAVMNKTAFNWLRDLEETNQKIERNYYKAQVDLVHKFKDRVNKGETFIVSEIDGTELFKVSPVNKEE
ncbi:hypothetical protein ACQW5G_00595 [Fructilactobacillus sp. Tb1]|uniref:hypothetical protein n=1 Tax=Fructilactobacillus sp. Tb1 TaxID=3422304 RepID=UPI003D29E55D